MAVAALGAYKKISLCASYVFFYLFIFYMEYWSTWLCFLQQAAAGEGMDQSPGTARGKEQPAASPRSTLSCLADHRWRDGSREFDREQGWLREGVKALIYVEGFFLKQPVNRPSLQIRRMLLAFVTSTSFCTSVGC